MFYDDKLMNCKTIGKVWRVANNIKGADDDVSLPKICRKLDEWVGSEEETASRRLSLRTSAMFIDGAAKLYKQGIQKLYDDIDSLDKAMLARKRPQSDSTDFSENCTTDTSQSIPTPEKIMRRHTLDVETSQMYEIRTQSSDNMDRFGDRPPSICSNKTSGRWTFHGGNNNIFIRDDNANSSPVAFVESTEHHEDVHRKEQEVQTTLTFPVNEDLTGENTANEFDENLPFGYVLIHDNYRSRIPSMIMFTSINADIKNIY